MLKLMPLSLLLGAMMIFSVAYAEPLKQLTADQMDDVTAGRAQAFATADVRARATSLGGNADTDVFIRTRATVENDTATAVSIGSAFSFAESPTL